MKILTLVAFSSLLAYSQDTSQKIQLPENSPLVQAILRTSSDLDLKDGSTLTIEITKAVETPRPAPAGRPSLNKQTLSLLSYKGKRGAPSSIAQAATRSGNTPDIRVVVLSPSDQAITHLKTPRLWWHQSSYSEGGELEFILTKLTTGGDEEVFRRLIPPMQAGFNVIDLSHPAVNPSGITLEPGHNYKWTISHRDGEKASPACSNLLCANSDLTPKAIKPTPDLLNHLSQSGNWHETLDLVATQAKLHPDKKDFQEARDRILKEAEILNTLKISQ